MRKNRIKKQIAIGLGWGGISGTTGDNYSVRIFMLAAIFPPILPEWER